MLCDVYVFKYVKVCYVMLCVQVCSSMLRYVKWGLYVQVCWMMLYVKYVSNVWMLKYVCDVHEHVLETVIK